jgi:Bifunctional DNA primase/polymerase, N-terminal
MTGTLDAVLDYAQRGWTVFPCHWHGERRKRPLIVNGLHAATRDEAQIRQWWQRWPSALIGVPTGRASGFVVLDIDVKDPRSYGYDTLAELGLAILPVTRMVHTSSDGLHLHFDPGGHEIRNTAGEKGRGIGPGLDWRGEGGYVIVPSAGGGYSWDQICGADTPLAAVPSGLLPREPERTAREPVEAVDGLSPYARAALDSACRNIVVAANGEQEATLNGECFAIGSLAGSGAIPESFALRTLLWAASRIRDYDARRRWRPAELEDKVERAFADGLSRPRAVRRHG